MVERLVEPSYDNIARRAYHLYEERGREHGHDQGDWFQTECELRWPALAGAIERALATDSAYAAT